jgi:two-component system, chemotaxis family, CheB/CheR fusion protein
MEKTPLAVIEWGPDLRICRWSAEAERVFGWTAEEVLGKRLDEFPWVHDAIKFTPFGGSISVRARVLPADRGEELVIEFSDTGIGIAPDMLPRLFNVFQQGAEGRGFGGLGLGLSISKAVIEMHGGAISASSDGPGKGATFTVKLPMDRCPLPDGRPLIGTDRVEGVDGIGTRKGLRIVLVEDHPDTARIMERLLVAKGHHVVASHTVTDGLRAVEESDPDVLISDLGLPDGSGLDLMRELRRRGKTIPAIALSGYGTAADIEKSKAAGFAEHIVKPIGSVKAFTEAVRRVAEGGARV